MRRKALLAMLAGLAGALRRCSLRLTAGTRLRAASGAPESTRLWSATDVLQFAKSPFAAWMDRRYASATGDDRAALDALRDPPDAFASLLARRGDAWERDVLAALRRERDVVDLSGAARRVRGDPAGATAATLEAMAARADVIYQAPVADATFLGVPDFLVRRDDGSYAIWDAKLSRRAAPNHVMQLCCYAELLGASGRRIDAAGLVLGGGDPLRPSDIPLNQYGASWRRLRHRFLDFAAAADAAADDPFDAAAAPAPRGDVARDAHGRWGGLAARLLADKDDLHAGVAGISRKQTVALRKAGLDTCSRLADLEPRRARVPGVRPDALKRLVAQARLAKAGGVAWAALPLPSDLADLVEPARAKTKPCPVPAAHALDCYFDLEGDPFLGDRGREYLWGVSEQAAGGLAYSGAWAHDEGAELDACRAFVAGVERRLEQSDGGAHVYHYGAYELSALRRVAASADRDLERRVEDLIGRGTFVDLYDVIKKHVLVGEPRYSLKNVEKLYRRRGGDGVNDAASSVVGYEVWLEGGQSDDALLAELLAYNKDDCDSTAELVAWLRSAFPTPRAALPQNPDDDGALASPVATAEDECRAATIAACLAGADDAGDAAAGWLDYHKRELRPLWRQKAEWMRAPGWQLADDERCVGACAVVGVVDAPAGGRRKRATYDMRFETPQPSKLRAGDAVLIRDDSLYEEGGFDQLRRGTLVGDPKPDGTLSLLASEPPPFRCSLLPDEFVNPAPLPLAALTNVRGVLDGRDGPLAAFLARKPPAFAGVEAGGDVLGPFRGGDGDATRAAVDAIAALDGSALAVQGPPGTGKTYLAARAIARLLEDGKRIALCAPSHATVANGVLAALAVVAPSDSIKVVKVGGRRRSKAPGAEDPERELAETAGVECRPRLDQTLVDEFLGGGAVLVGGSAWAFARDEARGRFDYLFVDEAGQVPAANVAAIAGCASNVVLLGDQMQLPAPQRAAHPGPLAGASALEYYSLGRGDGGSLPADVGVFLDVSRRLHPALCGAISELVYGGRLRAHADAAKRTVPGATALASADAGLVVVDVESSADRGDVATANLEEAAVVARVVGDVLDRKVFRDGDDERPLAPGDVLVVCPYNAHVGAVEDALEAAGVAGVKVGTVDRFQGREAPVVVASLAVATGDDETDGDFDAPSGLAGGRGVAFALDARRLNVALSRAQCLAILVSAPDLADGAPSSLERMRELAMLARLRELAAERTTAAPADFGEIPF